MLPLKIFIINLASSTTRREAIVSRMNVLGCNFEIFKAVDGRSNSHPLFQRYDDRRRLKARRRALSGGELGCWASHFLLWQRCVDIDRPIVVMEDDVSIDDNFIEALSIASEQLGHLKYLRLAGTSLHRRSYQLVDQIGSFSLADHVRGPSGTLCYVIHPEAAQALIKHSSSWFLAVDDYIDRYWIHGVDCYSLMPFPVTIPCLQGDIERLEKKKINLYWKLRQEIFRRADRFRRFCYRRAKIRPG